MKQLITTTVFLVLLVCLASVQTEQTGGRQMQTITIARNGSQPSSVS